jgi:hypothetical protein
VLHNPPHACARQGKARCSRSGVRGRDVDKLGR